MGFLKRFLDEYICCCCSGNNVEVPLYYTTPSNYDTIEKQRVYHQQTDPLLSSTHYYTANSTTSSYPSHDHGGENDRLIRRNRSDSEPEASNTQNPSSNTTSYYHISVPAMTDTQFQSIRSKMKELSYDDERVDTLMNYMNEHKSDFGVTCEQLNFLLDEISFSTMRQECLENLLPFVTDLDNVEQQEKHIMSQIEFHSDKQAMRDKIQNQLIVKRASAATRHNK